MSTQENAIVASAERIHAHAYEAGLACGLPKEVAAVRIIEAAFGICVADMIGPNAPVSRFEDAFRILGEKVRDQTLVFHALRHGRHF